MGLEFDENSNTSVNSNNNLSNELDNLSLKGQLIWQTSLINDELTLSFDDSTYLDVNLPQKSIMIRLSKNEQAIAMLQSISALLEHNFVEQWQIKPAGVLTFNVAEQNVTLTELNIHSSQSLQPLSLKLTDITLAYTDHTIEFRKAQLALITQLPSKILSPYTDKSPQISLNSEISQQQGLWSIMIEPSSKLTVAELDFSSEKKLAMNKLPNNTASANRVKLEKFVSHWQGKINMSQKAGLTFALQSNNQLNRFSMPGVIRINETNVVASIAGNLDEFIVDGSVITDNVLLAKVSLSGNLEQSDLVVRGKDLLLTDLLSLQIKSPLSLTLIDGALNYQLSGKFGNLSKGLEQAIVQPMDLSVSLNNLTGEVEDTWLQDVNWQQQFLVEHNKLIAIKSAATNSSIANIETATPLSNMNMTANISIENDKFHVQVEQLKGDVLGGGFAIDSVQWPFQADHSVEVQLMSIDLEKLLALDKKQGIVVTGKVSGEFPIFYDGQQFLMHQGALRNVSNGVIQVFNNPAVDDLKASSTELKLAFEALENLHYHHLYSAVSMASDGYMLLETEIKGRNPDLDNEVNLNLNLSYDLLGLLESLNITEHFENKVIKGLQNN
jgi:hypothetical protein